MIKSHYQFVYLVTQLINDTGTAHYLSELLVQDGVNITFFEHILQRGRLCA